MKPVMNDGTTAVKTEEVKKAEEKIVIPQELVDTIDQARKIVDYEKMVKRDLTANDEKYEALGFLEKGVVKLIQLQYKISRDDAMFIRDLGIKGKTDPMAEKVYNSFIFGKIDIITAHVIEFLRVIPPTFGSEYKLIREMKIEIEIDEIRKQMDTTR